MGRRGAGTEAGRGNAEMARPRREFAAAVSVSSRAISLAGAESRGVSHQLFHRLVAVDQKLRAAGEVGDGGLVHVDAEVVVERGEDFAELDGAVFGFGANSVGGADHLSG